MALDLRWIDAVGREVGLPFEAADVAELDQLMALRRALLAKALKVDPSEIVAGWQGGEES